MKRLLVSYIIGSNLNIIYKAFVDLEYPEGTADSAYIKGLYLLIEIAGQHNKIYTGTVVSGIQINIINSVEL
jgi:hypothetical protein